LTTGGIFVLMSQVKDENNAGKISAMRMGHLILCSAAILAASAQAGLVYSPFVEGGVATGVSAAGMFRTATARGCEPPIAEVIVRLNRSEGAGGDLYAGLNSDGVLVPLVNPVGVAPPGYGGRGFDFTQNQSASAELDITPLP
jgi:hypothetical protein